MDLFKTLGDSLKPERTRYFNGFGIEKVESISYLKYGEYMCIQCNRVIKNASEVIKNNDTDSLTINGINFCSSQCRQENRRGYDRIVTNIFK